MPRNIAKNARSANPSNVVRANGHCFTLPCSEDAKKQERRQDSAAPLSLSESALVARCQHAAANAWTFSLPRLLLRYFAVYSSSFCLLRLFKRRNCVSL